MTNRILAALAAALLIGWITPAVAQQPQQVVPCVPVANTTGFSPGCVNATATNPFPVTGTVTATPATPAAGTAGAGFPPGAVSVTGSATGSTGAVAATLAAAAGKFTYLCGFTATGNEAATGAVIAVTVTGTITGSLNFNISHPVTPTLGVLSPTMTPCVQGSAVNTAIVVTSAADAAGTNVSVAAWGYQQ